MEESTSSGGSGPGGPSPTTAAPSPASVLRSFESRFFERVRSGPFCSHSVRRDPTTARPNDQRRSRPKSALAIMFAIASALTVRR